MHTIRLEQFEGPLDLLLQLIEKEELDITRISLARVTEQFLQYIKELEAIDTLHLADYLGIAARLLVIKSQAILPNLVVESLEEEHEIDLAAQLILYKQYKEASKQLQLIEAKRAQSFIREKVFIERISFFPDSTITPEKLFQTAFSLSAQLKELDNLPKARVREAISIKDKIFHLQQLLSNQIETSLLTVLQSAESKTEVVVTFLALLELIKQRIFSVQQEHIFADITIRKTGMGFTEIDETEIRIEK